jgi:hypothetical protein
MDEYCCNHINPSDSEMKCTRQRGHPGEHCHMEENVVGYRNVWWPNPVAEPAK